jgi:hypothetical protein
MDGRFTDAKGREWTLAIVHQDAVRIRKELGVSLYSLCDNKLAGLAELLSDPEKLVCVVYDLVQKKADREGISPEDFGSAFSGETLEAMGDAFLEALTDFFPNRQTRKALAELRKKGKKVESLVMMEMETQLDALTPEIIAKRLMDNAKAEMAKNGTATASFEPLTSLPASAG